MLIKHLPAAALLAAFAVTAPPSALANDDNDLRDFARWRGCGDSPLSELTRTLDVIGLTKDQRLICFNEKRPGWTRNIGHVSGLHTDTALVGIDFRVQDGKLYGVGNNGGVYMLDTDQPARRWSIGSPCRSTAHRSASTSTRRPTGCASSATPGRTCGTTSTPAA